MAIAFARTSIHTRAKGHSAIAGAAYRAGAKLFDKRTGETHDYRNREDVQHTEILLPQHADTQFLNREHLWNAVEAAEKRKDAQLAKDVILALPKDCNLKDHIKLTQNFAKYHFVNHGLVVDFAIHDHGDGNPHAHLYVTTRRLHGDHFDKHKARDLNPAFAKGASGKSFITEQDYWGEHWREFQNNYFQQHAINQVVDANHILPQRHEGRIRGSETHYLKEENKLKREASIHITVNEPESVLNLLCTQQGVFSDRDIACLIHKNTSSQTEFDIATFRVKTHPDLIQLGPGDDGRERYTTKAHYEREIIMAERAHQLNLRTNHRVKSTLIKHAVKDFGLNAEQAKALSHLAKAGDISAIVGRAGTGKSYMMRAAKQMWEASGYRVHGTAVSGIASKGLEADSGIPSSTIHSFKAQLSQGSLTLNAKDVLVMDEAGMTDLHDLASLVDVAQETGAQLVLIGDHAQLQPIGPGAPFRAIVEQIGFSELNQIQRQVDPDDCIASIHLSQGSIDQAIDHYDAKHCIHLMESPQNKNENEEDDGGDSGGTTAITCLINNWRKGLTPNNITERLILAHRNRDVDALNEAARTTMKEHGYLSDESHTIHATHGPIELAAGDRIIFLRNNRTLGMSNGEFATVLSIHNAIITVQCGKKKTRQITFSTKDYPHFNYGYAATIHKAQGTTFDHTFVYAAGRAWDRFLTYVAMTRHRKSIHLYADQAEFKDLNALKSSLSHAPLKDSILDWPISYAIRRGFDPESTLGLFIHKLSGIKQRIYDKWLFVVNYKTFKAMQTYRQSLQSNTQRRELARQVATFVDLRQHLGAEAKRMRHELKKGEKLFKHPDYETYYGKILERNQLGYSLQQNYPLFEQALTLNRISRDTLDDIAKGHQRVLHINAYMNHHKKGQRVYCYHYAEKIQKELSTHYAHIAFVAKKEGLVLKDIVRQINRDAHTYQRLQVLKQLNPSQKRNFATVDRYIRVNREYKALCSDIYARGGYEKLSPLDKKCLNHHKAQLDQLAYTMMNETKCYAKGIAFYQLDKNKLAEGCDRHELRMAINALKQATLSPAKGDALCAKLLSNKRYYPLIQEQVLNWKQLYRRRNKHQRQETLAKSAPPFSSSTTKANSNLDANTIHEALVNLSEDFYRQILGEDCKHSGNHLRFGKKGSLSVTLTGPHAGHWYSFETDEGGGPLQLLMNPTFGWGLSFPEALKLGARLAGLSSEKNLPLAPILKKPAQPPYQEEDKTDKINKARYYYTNARKINGTLGERYLREQRQIQGDISAFRFHPRIRDDFTNPDGQHQVSYRPGLVIAAHNHQSELTAVQTILLDPTTVNKVDKNKVGAVKRTRGNLKGSAALIHSGKGNKVIIAEGPETAASLIQAEPDAHIYVTFGNIKNAASLGWLAEKHKTHTFYFAVDNDGPKVNNIKALQTVAEQLRDEYHIQSFMAIPHLSTDGKCDFNDILQAKGLDTVKRQLKDYRPIKVGQQNYHPAIPIDVHQHACGNKNNASPTPSKAIDWFDASLDLEWNNLKAVDNFHINIMKRYITLVKNNPEQKHSPALQKAMSTSAQKLLRHTKDFAAVTQLAPKLSDTIKQQSLHLDRVRDKNKGRDR